MRDGSTFVHWATGGELIKIIHYDEKHSIIYLVLLARYSLIFILMNLEEIGLLIRKRRSSLGIDQRALSEFAGVSVHTVSNIEAGRGNPTVSTLKRVLDVLGLEIDVAVKK